MKERGLKLNIVFNTDKINRCSRQKVLNAL